MTTPNRVDELHLTVDEVPISVHHYESGEVNMLIGSDTIVGFDKVRLLASFLEASVDTANYYRRLR